MPPFSLEFRPSVEKDLRRLPRDFVRRALERIEGLRENPFPRGVIKLAGAERIYRLRIGRYRVVYEVDTKLKKVVIQYVRHRKSAYE